MKRFVLVFVVLFLFTAYATAAEFLASKNSTKYHETSCKLAQKIKQENMVKFESPEDAIKAGYEPCKKCKPATATKAEK
jgi:micrococcal nuclease